MQSSLRADVRDCEFVGLSEVGPSSESSYARVVVFSCGENLGSVVYDLRSNHAFALLRRYLGSPRIYRQSDTLALRIRLV
jgi:hypothetical protein